MSGKLDKSLDEILSTRRKNARKPGRGGRRAPVGKAVTAAPAGGVQKTTKAKPAKGAAKPTIPTGPAPKGEGKIIVSGLPSDVNEALIKDYFKEVVGPVKRVQVTYGPNGVSRGIAMVIFHQAKHAADALQKCNGVNVDGRPIKVEVVLDARSAPAVAPIKNLSERVVQPKGQPKAKAQPKSAAAPKPATTNGAATTTAGRGRGRRRARAGRPKPKSAEELDAEMVDYFGAGENATTTNGAAAATNGAGDVGMEDEIS